MAPLHPRHQRFRNSISAGVAALALVCLSGCATASRIAPVSSPAADAPPPQTIVAWSQDEIAATINQSNITTATGGGLIFALIDAGINNSRAKKAESAIVPLRDALVAYDGAATLQRELEASLQAGKDGAATSSVAVRPFADRKVLESWIKNAEADSVLLIQPKYELTPDFESISFMVTASLHTKQPTTGGTALKRPHVPAGPRYYNVFVARIPNPKRAAEGGREQAIAAWVVDDAAPARETLDRGFATLARMIAHDLAQPGPAKTLYETPPGAKTRVVPFVPSAPLLGGSGFVEHEDDRHEWVRLRTGELYAVAK
jgi:hypothetical protein